ncbi:Ccr4 not transcription complex [Schistosoma japonicum]|nr:Ccr4 not transcription complex [Schistosoma japonicum]
MVLECNYSLNCNSESAKHNFADLEEFPALTKSKPISFCCATWKKQTVLPSEDFIESESTGNDMFTVSKKKRLKKKKKPTVYCEESTDDSSPIKYSDRCFFVRDKVKFISTSQPLLHENQFQFPQSQPISGAILINSDSHLSESPIVEATNSLQAEDEGFAEDLVDCTTNHHLRACFSPPTSASNIQPSDPTYHSLQIKPIYESRRINSLLPSYTTADQMTLLGSNQSALNSCPVNRERLLTSVRQTNSEQHARSMSPSNLVDIYLSSKDVNDLGDEDDMEGTDLLHLISNSLDRFNAIVHPLDNNMSALTSGLGESRNILSESYSSSRYSQDCLFPSDVVTKPMTILSSDKEYKLSNVSIDSKVPISKHINHSSLLSLNSELGQISGRLLDTNNSSCISRNTTYYPNIPSTIPINVTAPSVVGYTMPPPTGSIRVNNPLVDKSKSCWLTFPNGIQHNTKVLTPSVEPNNLLVDLINNNRNMLTDSDIEMLNYLNLDLRNLFRNVSTTATTPTCTTSIIGGPSLHQHVSNSISNTVNRYNNNNNSNWSTVTTNIDNKCKTVSSSVNDNGSLWNQNKFLQSKILLMNKTQLLRDPMLQLQTTTVSSLPLHSIIAAPLTPLDITKYECSNNISDKTRLNPSNKIIFNTRCMNVPYSKRINNNNFITSYSLPLVDGSKEWSTEATSSLPCVTGNSILAHSVEYHPNTSVSTVGSVVTTTSSCSITRTPPLISMNHPLITENSTTNCVPTIGPSPTASSKSKVSFGGLTLPICNNSTVKSGNRLNEGFRNTHRRRHNNIPSNTNVNSICSMATLNSSTPIYCEFAHDLTKVTCKFWEMGECFKGSTCPFLHGYPPELNIDQSNNK